ncbi:tRNA 2-selenouridine(34) synthase MnmH [Gymnodinialimonas sp. 2305UL16-5]|uniref:tRNA 2-selenouridine(34) synthase MnmH n=1 Tax=Gymnodinialimonas mytili TaxID=3126503 RepID=UPI0030AC3742
MPYTLTDLAALNRAGFDSIIDVRSPSEFAEDHVPGAVNMPVLSNDERARVGTIYTQDSPFKARKIGAALVARNAAAAIETHLMNRDGGWRPLVYCWRGGQRSGSFASILSQIGWRVDVLEGGYQSWRRHVVAQLYDAALPFHILRLDGFTGTAKTDILRRAGAMGAQVLDLEGLACHRGSILGDIDGPQPAQKWFETEILTALSGCDPSRPLLVEAESARIGALRLPPALWGAMKASPRIVLQTTPEYRARYLAAQYADLASNTVDLRARLDGLRALAGHGVVEAWLRMLTAGNHVELAQALITEHYDPAYGRLRRADQMPIRARIDVGDLGDAALTKAAGAVLDLIDAETAEPRRAARGSN